MPHLRYGKSGTLGQRPSQRWITPNFLNVIDIHVGPSVPLLPYLRCGTRKLNARPIDDDVEGVYRPD